MIQLGDMARIESEYLDRMARDFNGEDQSDLDPEATVEMDEQEEYNAE